MSKDPVLNKSSQMFSSNFKQLHIWEQRDPVKLIFLINRISVGERPGGFNKFSINVLNELKVQAHTEAEKC